MSESERAAFRKLHGIYSNGASRSSVPLPARPGDPKKYSDMTEDERSAFKKQLGIRR